MRYFCEGAYFIRIELKLIRNHADGSENICVRDFIMRKLKRINVPNIQEQLSQSNENRAINKKKLRRFIFMFIFIAAATLYVQFILTKQQEIIVEKRYNNEPKTIAFKER